MYSSNKFGFSSFPYTHEVLLCFKKKKSKKCIYIEKIISVRVIITTIATKQPIGTANIHRVLTLSRY